MAKDGSSSKFVTDDMESLPGGQDVSIELMMVVAAGSDISQS